MTTSNIQIILIKKQQQIYALKNDFLYNGMKMACKPLQKKSEV